MSPEQHADLLNVKVFHFFRRFASPRCFFKRKTSKSTRTPTVCREPGWLTDTTRESLPDVSEPVAAHSQSRFGGLVLTSKPLPEPWRQLAMDPLPGEPPAQTGCRQLSAFGPNLFSVFLRGAATFAVVVSENWYPGWKAESDGKSARCIAPMEH